MNSKFKTFLFFIIGAAIGVLLVNLYNKYTIVERADTNFTEQNSVQNNTSASGNSSEKIQNISENAIDELTKENIVIGYVKENHRLPDYYITKSEARREGWNPSQGNLCDVLPGRAIGGDKFSNREKTLPKGEQYYEADVNYNCGNRNADRIVFTKNGDVWLTHDHYRSFEKK